MREKEIYRSDASSQSIMSGRKFPVSIESIANVLPKASIFSYPAVTGIRTSPLKVSEVQLNQARILENITGREGSSRIKIMKHLSAKLVLEVGEESTRAFLFDIVEGSYRLVAVGESHTLFESPNGDTRIGIRQACDQLSQITGLNIFQSDNNDHFRVHSNGKKSHAPAIVLPCNHPLTVVIINVSTKNSITDFRKFFRGYPAQIIGEVSIDTDGPIFPALDIVVRLKPDFVYIAGLKDKNDNHLLKKIERITRLTRISIPADQQPVFINGALNSVLMSNQRSPYSEVSNIMVQTLMDSSVLGRIDSLKVNFADNVLSGQKKKIPEFPQVIHRLRKDVISGCEAFGRIINYLDLSTGMNNGVLGINIEPSKTSIAVAQSGELRLEVFPQFGSFTSISNILENYSLREISEWLPQEVSEQYVEEYLLNKSLYPSAIPVSEEDLDIEFAIAQHILKLTISESNKEFQNKSKIKPTEIRPAFDRIIAAGGILSQGQDLMKTTLVLLNGIQLTGAATFFLDTNQIVCALGAAAVDRPLLAVQVLDSGIITHLCTLIAVESEAEDGAPILRMRMVCQTGDEENFEIKKGDFFRLPLSNGEIANLFLQPFHGCDVGMGAPGRGGVIRVTGGHIGVIIDARGRPLALQREKHHRIAQIKGWYRALNGDIK